MLMLVCVCIAEEVEWNALMAHARSSNSRVLDEGVSMACAAEEGEKQDIFYVIMGSLRFLYG